MVIFRIVGFLIALAMAGAAILAIIYANTIWTAIWSGGAVAFGVFSLAKSKKQIQNDSLK